MYSKSALPFKKEHQHIKPSFGFNKREYSLKARNQWLQAELILGGGSNPESATGMIFNMYEKPFEWTQKQ